MDERERLQHEIESWKYIAEGLTYEHQLSIKLDILRKVNNLEEQLKDLLEE